MTSRTQLDRDVALRTRLEQLDCYIDTDEAGGLWEWIVAELEADGWQVVPELHPLESQGGQRVAPSPHYAAWPWWLERAPSPLDPNIQDQNRDDDKSSGPTESISGDAQ